TIFSRRSQPEAVEPGPGGADPADRRPLSGLSSRTAPSRTGLGSGGTQQQRGSDDDSEDTGIRSRHKAPSVHSDKKTVHVWRGLEGLAATPPPHPQTDNKHHGNRFRVKSAPTRKKGDKLLEDFFEADRTGSGQGSEGPATGWTNCHPKRPLMQRWPCPTSWSAGEGALTIRLSWTCNVRVQPTPQ